MSMTDPTVNGMWATNLGTVYQGLNITSTALVNRKMPLANCSCDVIEEGDIKSQTSGAHRQMARS